MVMRRKRTTDKILKMKKMTSNRMTKEELRGPLIKGLLLAALPEIVQTLMMMTTGGMATAKISRSVVLRTMTKTRMRTHMRMRTLSLQI